MKYVKTVCKRKPNPLKHCPGKLCARCCRGDAEEYANCIGIIVRGTFARQVWQKQYLGLADVAGFYVINHVLHGVVSGKLGVPAKGMRLRLGSRTWYAMCLAAHDRSYEGLTRGTRRLVADRKYTPDVPSEIMACLGLPLPRRSRLQRCRRHPRPQKCMASPIVPQCQVPGYRDLGAFEKRRHMIDSQTGCLQELIVPVTADTSSHIVPAESDISEAKSPVIL